MMGFGRGSASVALLAMVAACATPADAYANLGYEPASIPTIQPLPEAEKEHLECAKGKHKVRKHGQVRCVANKARKHKHHRRRARRAVNAHRGGKR